MIDHFLVTSGTPPVSNGVTAKCKTPLKASRKQRRTQGRVGCHMIHKALSRSRVLRYGWMCGAVALIWLLSHGAASAGTSDFIRSDANGDGTLNLADPISILLYIVGEQELTCHDAADANDDGSINVVDAVYLLGYLFGSTDPPPPPYPNCGPDPTADDLGCEQVASCP